MGLRNRTITVVEKITAGVGSVESVIIHTVVFAGALLIGFTGLVDLSLVLLVVTTIVSLEAIYLAIFIQMTVNRNTQSLMAVEDDIEEISEDVEEIQGEIEELGDDVEEIQEDIEEINEDVEEIQEDIEEITEEEEEKPKKVAQKRSIKQIEKEIDKLTKELEKLRGER